MDNIDFCKLACSTDESRYNLTSVYRDTDHFVGTDGHRLHYCPGSKVEKGFYLNGTDATFPDWKQILPKGEPIATMQIRPSKELISQIKAFVKLVECFDPNNFACDVVFGENKLKCRYAQGFEASLTLPIAESTTVNEAMNPINLSFVFDVIFASWKFHKDICPIEVRYFGKDLVWEFDIKGLGKALIMPLKLKK